MQIQKKNFSFLVAILILVCSMQACKKKEDVIIPVAPTDLTALVITKTKIHLSWTDRSTNEKGFKIERKAGTGTFSTVGETGSDVTSFVDSLPALNIKYTYRVYSFNDGGKSSTYTNEASITSNAEAPTAVTSPPISRTATSLTFSGQVNPNGAITTVIFEYGLGFAFNLQADATPKTITGTSVKTVTATVTGLNASWDYYYRVKAVNALGTSYGATVFSPTWGF